MVSKFDIQSSPLVSIIVPFYNSFDTIERCLLSVQNQSYINFEIIVVDDCSNESFSDVFLSFIEDDNRIKCITHSKNRGVSYARNTGIQNSIGDFIYFLDADDWIDKNALNDLTKNIKNSQLCVAPHMQYLGEGNVRKKSYFFEEKNSILDEDLIYKYVINYLKVPYKFIMFVHCWNKLYLAKIIKENKILFNTELSQLEDVNFNFKYLKFVNNIYYSNTYEYFHFIANKSSSASGLAGTENFSDSKCDMAFLSVYEFLSLTEKISPIEKQHLLRHHFASTAIIYLIILTRRFINNPNYENYIYIKKWIKSDILKINIDFYKVQKNESYLLSFAIKLRIVSLFICICFFRIQIINLFNK